MKKERGTELHGDILVMTGKPYRGDSARVAPARSLIECCFDYCTNTFVKYRKDNLYCGPECQRQAQNANRRAKTGSKFRNPETRRIQGFLYSRRKADRTQLEYLIRLQEDTISDLIDGEIDRDQALLRQVEISDRLKRIAEWWKQERPPLQLETECARDAAEDPYISLEERALIIDELEVNLHLIHRDNYTFDPPRRGTYSKEELAHFSAREKELRTSNYYYQRHEASNARQARYEQEKYQKTIPRKDRVYGARK